MAQAHQVSDDTRAALAHLRAQNGASLRALARQLNYPPQYATTLSQVLRAVPGSLSLESENILRQRLGLSPLQPYLVAPCPDCGGLHVGRCHHQPAEKTVVLGPGQRVVSRPRREPAADLWKYRAAANWLAARYRVPDTPRTYDKRGRLTTKKPDQNP